MNKWIVIIAVISGVYYFGYKPNQNHTLDKNVAHNEIIMYSLTTCGFCKQKREILDTEGMDI